MHTCHSLALGRGRRIRAGVSTLGILGVAAASMPLLGANSGAASVRRITDLVVAGHGWGPGIGMGQWGDFGYAAKYHQSYAKILAHYYGGSTLATLSSLSEAVDPSISVVIAENMNTTTNIGFDPVVTSFAAFSIISATGSVPTTTSSTSTTAPTTTTSAPTTSTTVVTSSTTTTTPSTTTTTPSTLPVSTTLQSPAATPSAATNPSSGVSFPVPAGDAVDLTLQPDGTWNAYVGSSCTLARDSVATAAPVVQGLSNPVISPGAPTGNVVPLLTLCRHDGIDEPINGQIQALDRSGYERTLNLVPLQTYLDGVVPAEESASWGTLGGTLNAPQGQAWGFQALEAQAVAARSYVLAYAASGGWNGYATICDNSMCQAYVGASYESPLSSLAVSDTLGQVLVGVGSSAVLSARYSASTGGWTAPGTFPAVRDRGDGCVVPGRALECNPNHSWQATYAGVTIERRFPSIGLLLRIRVTSRNGLGYLGGRAMTVAISGSKGRVRVTGSQFAVALGLRSDWFAIGSVHRTRTRVST